MNTNRWMQEVNARFPVRKSKVQKAQFRQYVLQKAQEMGYAARLEEKGLLGASGLAKAHKQAAKETLVLNMDCIGVGICACRKKKHVGWYCSKIHTRHDTTYDEITLQGVADTVEAVLRQVVGKEQA